MTKTGKIGKNEKDKNERVVTTTFIWHQVRSEWKPDWFQMPGWSGYDSGNVGNWLEEPFEKIRNELKFNTDYEIEVIMKIKEK